MEIDHGRSAGGAALRPHRGAVALDGLRPALEAAAGYGLPLLLVVYLSLKGGGYDSVIRSEIGVLSWWLVIIGALIGILPRARLGTTGLLALGALLGFGVWTALGIGWSESAERSVAELGRVATYLGIFTLAILIQGRDGLRRTVGGLATGVAVVGTLALLSRLHPSWFPPNETAELLPGAQARLSYPLNYWNGLAALIAMGIPLLLGCAASARSVLARALATAAIPALALAAFFTLSRGGAIELGVGLVAFFLLAPRRLAALPATIVAAGGSALLIAAATQRDALTDGLVDSTAASQGDEMLVMALVVCAGAGLLGAALGLAAREGIGPRLKPAPATTAVASLATAGAAVVIAISVGLPGVISDGWEEFKAGGGAGDDASRFISASGNGRYQYWQSSMDANETAPLTGIGPGTFEYWWAEEGSLPGFVRDAHSLYFEALAEVGVVGFALIVALIGGGLLVGLRRTRQGSERERMAAAAATAAAFAFATAAGVDWVWELPVVPIAFLLLFAGLLAPRRSSTERVDGDTPRAAMPLRVAIAAVALVAAVAIVIPMASTSSIRDSQADARALDLDSALANAGDAGEVQPYAATPPLQEALVLELQGDIGPAVVAAEEATAAEPTNWRTWLVLSRLEATRGNAAASVEAYRQARELNPRSPLFAPVAETAP